MTEGGVFDPKAAENEERAPDLITPTQKPMSTRSADYVETGFLPVVPHADGGVAIGGGEPPGPAVMLEADNFICEADEATGRPSCVHLVQWLTAADGKAAGFDKMYQMRRFCTRMATASELMELGEIEVFACSARSPVDVTSEKLVANFRRRQREQAEEHAQTSGDTTL